MRFTDIGSLLFEAVYFSQQSIEALVDESAKRAYKCYYS